MTVHTCSVRVAILLQNEPICLQGHRLVAHLVLHSQIEALVLSSSEVWTPKVQDFGASEMAPDFGGELLGSSSTE